MDNNKNLETLFVEFITEERILRLIRLYKWFMAVKYLVARYIRRMERLCLLTSNHFFFFLGV